MWKQSPYKADFLGADNKVYFNTPAEGLLLTEAAKALFDYVNTKSLGTIRRFDLFNKHTECRSAIGRLLNAPPETIAFLGNSSEAMGLIATALPLKKGDDVVLYDLEFPSGILTWLRMKEKYGIRLTMIRNQDWNITEEEILKAISERTRVVYVSHVSYKNGLKLDIQRIGEMAHKSGAYFIVDATQALGRIPVSVKNVDFLMSSTFKWLCSAHGLGIIYCSRELQKKMTPDRLGWWSVITDKFEEGNLEEYESKQDAVYLETGMPNFPSLYSLRAAVSYLNSIGIEVIDRELEPLGKLLCDGLEQLKLKLLTPADPRGHAGIFTFAHPKGLEIVSELQSHAIYTWGKPGRIRVGIHLYNDVDDVERFLSILGTLVKKYS